MVRGISPARMTGRRLSLAVIAFGCLLAQVSALAHRVLVQHVTCAEHGETVHLRAAAPATDDTGLAANGASGLPALSFAERFIGRAGSVPVAAADEHDHCSVAASRSLTSQSNLDGAGRLLPYLGRVDATHEAIAGAVVAPYRIAPKTSPPRPA